MLIQAKNISKSFDKGKHFALKNVSVEIGSGEFIAIIGLSGAGKSTFLRAINGTNTLSSGELIVLGQELSRLQGKKLRALRKQIGFVFQQFNLVKNLSIVQNVLMGRIAYMPLWRALTGIFSTEDKKIALEALSSIGLEGRYHEQARNLSGGQQQRVAIARALVQNPQIILADEPMASLDPKLAEVILDILAKVNRENKITVLINIHSMELAKKYAKRILAFRYGELVFDGTPASLNAEQVEKIYAVDMKHLEQL